MSGEVDMPPRRCPRCKNVHDKATAMNGEDVRPKEGDWTVCLNCAAGLRFGRELALQEITPAELMTASREERLYLVLATHTVLAIHRNRQLH